MLRFYPVSMNKEQSTPLIHPNALNARSFGLNQRESGLHSALISEPLAHLVLAVYNKKQLRFWVINYAARLKSCFVFSHSRNSATIWFQSLKVRSTNLILGD